jgi:hypothetical protein
MTDDKQETTVTRAAEEKDQIAGKARQARDHPITAARSRLSTVSMLLSYDDALLSIPARIPGELSSSF